MSEKPTRKAPAGIKAAALAGAAALVLAIPATADVSSELYGPTAEDPQRGGSLTYGSMVEPPALDPFHEGADARIRVTTLIYQGLFFEGEEDAVPLLATGFELSDDELVYTFHLREGVRFHNGGEMMAEDVKYSYDYIRDPDNGSPGAGDFSMVKSIEVIDDHIVQFHLESPNASLPMTLGNKYGAVVPAGLFDEENIRARLNEESFGTGPFRLRAYEPNSFLELERFEDYWEEGVPYLDEITYLYLPSSAALTVALEQGRVDLARIGQPRDAERLEARGDIQVSQWPSLEQKAIDLDGNHEPLDDERVRQAISLAVDKEEILQAAVSGYGTVIHTIVAGMQQAWGVDPDELEFQGPNRERARELLAEAGYEDGFDLTLTTIIGYDWMGPAGVTLQEQLADVGINLSIERVDLGVWIDNFRNYNMGFTFNDWATQPDPNLLFFRHFHKRPEGADFRNWNNEQASELLMRGQRESDPEARREIYREFQKELAQSVPTIMLFSADYIIAANERVQNYHQHPTGWHFGLAKTYTTD